MARTNAGASTTNGAKELPACAKLGEGVSVWGCRDVTDVDFSESQTLFVFRVNFVGEGAAAVLRCRDEAVSATDLQVLHVVVYIR